MPRIFSCLGIGQLIVLTGAAALGFAKLDVNADRHVLSAVLALLLSCLVQVVAFTYLIIAGKIIGQAVHLGGLDLDAVHEAARLKRSVTCLMAVLLVSIVLVTASGANRWRTGAGTMLHVVGACTVIVVHAVVLYREYDIVVRAAALLERTLLAYRRHRQAKIVGRGDERSLDRSTVA